MKSRKTKSILALNLVALLAGHEVVAAVTGPVEAIRGANPQTLTVKHDGEKPQGENNGPRPNAPHDGGDGTGPR